MHYHTPMRVLILGGTSESRVLAARLAEYPGLDVQLSLAGRTESPAEQSVPTRSGGFGGVQGLTEYLVTQRIDALVVATHPFAAQIAAHAAEASRRVGIPAIRLQRPAWVAQPQDKWLSADSIKTAASMLKTPSRRVLLTIGRQQLAPFEQVDQHYYVIRSVDPLNPPPLLSHYVSVQARGPFTLDDELELMRRERIDVLVTKNSGSQEVHAKLDAARQLGIEVIMIERPISEEPINSVPHINMVRNWAIRLSDQLAD